MLRLPDIRPGPSAKNVTIEVLRPAFAHRHTQFLFGCGLRRPGLSLPSQARTTMSSSKSSKIDKASALRRLLAIAVTAEKRAVELRKKARLAKATSKQARRIFKLARKVAKQARKEAKAAAEKLRANPKKEPAHKKKKTSRRRPTKAAAPNTLPTPGPVAPPPNP